MPRMLQPALACDTTPPSTVPRPLALWGLWLAAILAIGPFIVRRIVLIGDDDYAHWMAVDTLARCTSLIGVALGFRTGLLQRAQPRADWPRSLRIFLLLLAAEYVEQTIGAPVLQHYFRFAETTAWPPIPDFSLRMADLSAGLLFAVLVEEVVFRKFLFALVERWTARQVPVIAISATTFALIHFTSGVVDTMLNALVHGIFLGLAYAATRRLSICVASHYLVDFLIFAGR